MVIWGGDLGLQSRRLAADGRPIADEVDLRPAGLGASRGGSGFGPTGCGLGGAGRVPVRRPCARNDSTPAPSCRATRSRSPIATTGVPTSRWLPAESSPPPGPTTAATSSSGLRRGRVARAAQSCSSSRKAADTTRPSPPPPTRSWWCGTRSGGCCGRFDHRIEGRRLSHDGAPRGDRFEVSAAGEFRYTFAPDVAARRDGAFVVAWQGNRASAVPNRSDVFAQRFDSSGARAGAELQVNTYTRTTNRAPP